MNQNLLSENYIDSIDEFLDSVPDNFLKTLRKKILQGKEDEALNLICQYVTKFFTYISYDSCYNHGHFVYALLQKIAH